MLSLNGHVGRVVERLAVFLAWPRARDTGYGESGRFEWSLVLGGCYGTLDVCMLLQGYSRTTAPSKPQEEDRCMVEHYSNLLIARLGVMEIG